MNNRLKYRLLGLLGLVFFLIGISCAEPSPLYGTWADSRGNTVSFFDDNTFNARISGQNYGGRYTLLLNALTIDCDGIELRIVTEWDIRGNILYLDWTTVSGDMLSLTLFKVSN